MQKKRNNIDCMEKKILSKKNIESLGFVFFEKEGNKEVFINKNDHNRDEKIHFGDIQNNARYIAIENNCGQFYFMGYIENKKDLKKVLVQTGVGFKLVQL